jgi:hypothetical protein
VGFRNHLYRVAPKTIAAASTKLVLQSEVVVQNRYQAASSASTAVRRNMMRALNGDAPRTKTDVCPRMDLACIEQTIGFFDF